MVEREENSQKGLPPVFYVFQERWYPDRRILDNPFKRNDQKGISCHRNLDQELCMRASVNSGDSAYGKGGRSGTDKPNTRTHHTMQ